MPKRWVSQLGLLAASLALGLLFGLWIGNPLMGLLGVVSLYLAATLRHLYRLDRALERSPDHIAALAGKALTLTGLGRIDAAQGILRRALELNPWLPERGMLIEKPGEDI